MKRIAACMVSITFLVTLMGCGSIRELPEAESTLFAMNTYMTFTAYGENAETALAESSDLIVEMEALWSVTDRESEIYKANHSGGQTITVSQETAELLSFALEMAKKTNGALDPTIYPLLTAWGFTTDTKQVPSDEEITSLLQYVGYDRIQLEDENLTVLDGMELDLGAVGKG